MGAVPSCCLCDVGLGTTAVANWAGVFAGSPTNGDKSGCWRSMRPWSSWYCLSSWHRVGVPVASNTESTSSGDICSESVVSPRKLVLLPLLDKTGRQKEYKPTFLRR